MTSVLKISCLMTAVFLAGCETYSLEKPRENLTEKKQTELINRDEVIAIVSSVDVAADLEQQAARWGYDLKRKEMLDGLGLYLLTFDCPPGIDPHVASLELERLQPLSTVEANHKYKLQSAKQVGSVTSLSAPRKYANTLIDWPTDGCEALSSIGLIDGRVDTETLLMNSSAMVETRMFMDGILSDDAAKHGTAIAEVLVGAGRLKNAKLYNAAVVSEDASGAQFSGVKPILKALNWMVKSDVGVVNISLAGPYNRTLDRGIQRAVDKGLIVVAAVGNAGPDSPPLYPAALKDVIAATAVDSDGNIYSNAVQGDHIDIAAPGVDVFVGKNEKGRYVSGTSIATPFIVAKIASDSRYENMKSVKEIRTFLSSNSRDLGAVGHDIIYGAGLLQANKNCL